MAASVAMNLGVIGNLHGSNERPTYIDLGGDKKIDVAGIGLQGLRLVQAGQSEVDARQRLKEAAEKARQKLSEAGRMAHKIKLRNNPILKIGVGIQNPNSVPALAENLFILIGGMACYYNNQSIKDITGNLESIVMLSEQLNLNDANQYISDFCFDIRSFAKEALKTRDYYGYGNGIIKNIIDRLPYESIAMYLRNNTFLCDEQREDNIRKAYDFLFAVTDIDLYFY